MKFIKLQEDLHLFVSQWRLRINAKKDMCLLSPYMSLHLLFIYILFFQYQIGAGLGSDVKAILQHATCQYGFIN